MILSTRLLLLAALLCGMALTASAQDVPAPYLPGLSKTVPAPATAAPAHVDMSMDKLAEGLKAKLDKNPNNLQGWILLSKTYRTLNQNDKAEAVDAKIKELQKKGVIKEAAAPAMPNAVGLPAPTDGAAASMIMNADPVEQNKMIHGMVDGLAEKLKKNPDDLQGWQQLAKSYRVLGEIDKAKEAEAKVAALTAKAGGK